MGKMDQAHVETSENSIYIHKLEVPVKEVADFFRGIPTVEHDFVLMKAIEVGVFCLERAGLLRTPILLSAK